LCGYGRSDWSTKLIRGLTSEAAAGFQSRRGLNHDDSAPVTPHNAPFPTYKAAPVHHAALRRGGVAARGECAAGRADAASWRAVELCRKRFGSAVDGGSAPSNAAGIGIGGGPQPSN